MRLKSNTDIRQYGVQIIGFELVNSWSPVFFVFSINNVKQTSRKRILMRLNVHQWNSYYTGRMHLIVLTNFILKKFWGFMVHIWENVGFVI